jgi:acetyltransferase-like isoleucine patch superfamily enzyme
VITYGGRYLGSAELESLGIKRVGRNVAVHSTSVLVGLENISIGNHVRVDPFSCLIAGTGRIEIGNHVHIASHVFLSGAEGIEVGEFSSFSRGVTIYTRNEDYSGLALTNPTIPVKYLRLVSGPVVVGRHAVVGAMTVVFPRVSIGEGSATGALSLIKDDLEPWTIYAGVPARRLRERSRDLLALEAQLEAEERLTDE